MENGCPALTRVLEGRARALEGRARALEERENTDTSTDLASILP